MDIRVLGPKEASLCVYPEEILEQEELNNFLSKPDSDEEFKEAGPPISTKHVWRTGDKLEYAVFSQNTT
jgi:hypothetical protein